jgi:hypothetical protein
VTLFGTDRSHYQGPLAESVCRQLALFTHKVTDGDHFYADAAYAGAVNRVRGYGIAVLGSYHVLHGQRSVAAQARWWYERVDALTPWWREYSAGGGQWTWQADCEPFDYLTAPTIAEINALGDAVCALAGCPPESFLVYAPAWHYRSALTGLRYPHYWASAYGANPAGDYRAVYPGDDSPRWSAAAVPALVLQYGSRTSIGDADAVRAALPDLLAKLNPGGGSMAAVEIDLLATKLVAPGTPYDGWTLNNALATLLGRVPTNLAGQLTTILTAANDDPAVTLPPEAVAALAARIAVEVGAKIHDPAQAVAELTERLAEGAQAAAQALATPPST